MSLRQAAEADVPGLTELVRSAYVHYVERLGGPPRPMTDDYADVVRTRRVIVAEQDGEIVGLLVLGVDDEGFFVDNVAVDPLHQGIGVGKALLEHAELAAREAGFNSIYLYTHERMTENLALYERMGYVEYDRRENEGARIVYLRKALTERLSLARIEEASRVIDPLFRDTPQFIDPQLSAALGREVILKVETANPLGSFKGRGADFFVRELEPGRRLVCSTGGNFGQALAYAGRRRGFPVEVFVSAALDEGKLARIRALASEVFVIEGDEERAKEAAHEHTAARPERLFVEDGRELAISEGAGTIGVELLAAAPIDTLLVQVGDGALIGGVARWVKERSPSTRVIGVCPSGSPAMFRSWREGRPVAAPAETIASALAVARPVPESVARIRPLIDEFVLVDDRDMIDAMRIAARTLGVLLEPAGAAGIAALYRHELEGERFAVLLTGHGVPKALRDAVLGSERGR